MQYHISINNVLTKEKNYGADSKPDKKRILGAVKVIYYKSTG